MNRLEGTLKIKKEEDEKDIIQEEKRDEDSSSERTHPLKVLEHLVVVKTNFLFYLFIILQPVAATAG